MIRLTGHLKNNNTQIFLLKESDMDLFAHRIHRATCINGIVKLEFSMIKPDKNGKFDPEQEVEPGEESFSVNVPLPGFMRSMGNMREMMRELAEAGQLPGMEGQGEEAGSRAGAKRKKMRDITKDDDSGEQLV